MGVKRLATYLNLTKLKCVVIFISGFVLWLLDAQLCTTLISLRHQLGMPWSFFLELHGWYVTQDYCPRDSYRLLSTRWHIFTAIGAYIFIVLVEYLTTDAAGSEPAGRYAWPTSKLLGVAAGSGGGGHGKKE
jgi:dihydroceramidase